MTGGVKYLEELVADTKRWRLGNRTTTHVSLPAVPVSFFSIPASDGTWWHASSRNSFVCRRGHGVTKVYVRRLIMMKKNILSNRSGRMTDFGIRIWTLHRMIYMQEG